MNRSSLKSETIVIRVGFDFSSKKKLKMPNKSHRISIFVQLCTVSQIEMRTHTYTYTSTRTYTQLTLNRCSVFPPSLSLSLTLFRGLTVTISPSFFLKSLSSISTTLSSGCTSLKLNSSQGKVTIF